MKRKCQHELNFLHNFFTKKLIYVLRALVWEIFLKLFMEEEKKNLTFFFNIFHKNGIKSFLKWSINKYFKNTY